MLTLDPSFPTAVQLTRKVKYRFRLLSGFPLVLTGGVFLWLAQILKDEPLPSLLFLYAFGGFLACLGLLFLWSVACQFVQRRVPGIVIELSEQALKRGSSFTIKIMQPGPVKRRRLRLSIACVQYGFSQDAGIYRQDVLDASNISVQAEEIWVETRVLNLPENLPKSESGSVGWRIEAQGWGPFLADFKDTFKIKVS